MAPRKPRDLERMKITTKTDYEEVSRLWRRGKWKTTRCQVFSAYCKHHCWSQ